MTYFLYVSLLDDECICISGKIHATSQRTNEINVWRIETLFPTIMACSHSPKRCVMPIHCHQTHHIQFPTHHRFKYTNLILLLVIICFQFIYKFLSINNKQRSVFSKKKLRQIGYGWWLLFEVFHFRHYPVNICVNPTNKITDLR